MLAFGMFLFVSIFFVVLGIISWRSEKPVRFWNISQEIQVSDIKKYNRAVSKMWFVFAVYLAAAGLPVLHDKIMHGSYGRYYAVCLGNRINDCLCTN